MSLKKFSAAIILNMIVRSGRRKIVYAPEDLERAPLLTIVCGMKEVGKTYQTLKDIDSYTKDNERTGRKARKVLILDFNAEESYQRFPAVLPKYIRTLTEPRARRILPYDERGRKFTIDKMKDVAEYVISDNYLNGLVVMEDIDKYMTGAKGQSLIGAMCTNRHSGMDMIITHQSVTKVSQTEWQNAAWVRLHHQLDDVDRIEENLPNYPLMKIAQIIVDKRYFLATEQYRKGLIDKDEFMKRRSFFVYINMLEHKILLSEESEFKSAVMEFVRQNPRLITKRMKIGDEFGNEFTKDEAMKSLYNDYAHFRD